MSAALTAILAAPPVDAGVAPQAATMPAMPAPGVSASAATTPFGQIVSQGLDQLNGDLLASQVDMQRLAAGDAPDLHRIMIHLEESQLSFQLMMQVRSRLLDAYQDVMKMQV
ncbi:MAG TPA: flagellar hook-basal body complex protein FliE [Burkholderiaceae bacterium]